MRYEFINQQGKNLTNHHSQDLTKTYTAFPAKIFNNIQKRFSSTTFNFKIERLRKISQQRIGLNRNSFSDNTNLYLSTNTPLMKRTSIQLRSNTFKNSLLKYDNGSMGKIIPHHSLMLYQNYQVAELKRPSLKRFNSKSKELLRRNLISLDDNLLSNFNNLTININQEDKNDLTNDIGSIENYDNTFYSNVTELKSQLEKTTKVPQLSVKKNNSLKETSSYIPDSPEHIGRIQQKLNHLRSLNETQQDISNYKKFSNIEQKLLLEFSKIELQNLKRFGFKPLQDSIQRVFKIQNEINELKTKDRIIIISPEKSLIKSYNPLKTREECSINELHSKSPIQPTSQPPPKREANLKKLKILLKTSAIALESLWKDYYDINNPEFIRHNNYSYC